MQITFHNIKWAARWLPKHFRIWWHFLRCPVFTLKLLWKRIAFTATRRLVGRSIKSPLTGKYIDNVQTLICYWAIFIVRELDHPSWKKELERDRRKGTTPVVMDIGSNMGVFTDYIKYLCPQAEVLTFDPLPASNSLYKVAIGTSPSVTLHKAANGGVGAGIHAEGEAFVCPGARLDEYASKKPVLLKIDVDGMELDVLESGPEVLKNVKNVIIEFGPETRSEVIRRLGAAGLDRHCWNKTEDLIFWRSQ